MGVNGLFCIVQLTWTATPNGEQYVIQRTNGSTTTTTLAGPTTAAGTTTDTVALALLLGKPSYATKASWVLGPLWTVTSPAVPAEYRRGTFA